ncbi:hypothetical protein [Microvirga sp. TS319]|uniref:hypothetical protein n=1 Tax=Microvirga sp. TS319 TaxID=3241165 RepID=UPI00351A0D8E
MEPPARSSRRGSILTALGFAMFLRWYRVFCVLVAVGLAILEYNKLESWQDAAKGFALMLVAGEVVYWGRMFRNRVSDWSRAKTRSHIESAKQQKAASE